MIARGAWAAHLGLLMPDAVPSSTPPHWLRGIVVVLLMLGILAAAAGALYENIFEARDRRFNPMPGRLVDVGGLKMHIDCTGEGSPAVVLDSGLGDSYISWRKAQPLIAKFSRVCSYDRAGLGYSDPSPRPRTSKNIAEELHGLLRAAGIAAPYVLVGHSMGGFDVRLYASLYRSDVAGVVLVDSSHPEQENRVSPEVGQLDRSALRVAELLEFTTPFGVRRLLGLCGGDAITHAAVCNWQNARTGVKELRAFSESASETAATGSLGGTPLIVLSRDPHKLLHDLSPDLEKRFADTWEKMQEELVQISTCGAQVIVKNSGHYIQTDQPEAVAEAARNVVDQARSDQAAATAKR